MPNTTVKVKIHGDAGSQLRVGKGVVTREPGQDIEDKLVESHPATPRSTTPVAAKSSGRMHRVLATAGVGLALMVGSAMLPATASAATNYGSQYVQACYDSPYAYQDQALMRHMAGLSNSPLSGYNRAAGLYDGRSHFTVKSLSKNRIDGDQAYNRLTCNMPVRLFSPQTGWLKFNNIPDLHRFVSVYGMPWDNPNGIYNFQPNPVDPWYDDIAIQYNNYDFSNYLFNNMPQYVAPPSNYAPPADWQVPGQNGLPAWQQNNGNAAPPDTRPVIPVWQQGGTNQAPADTNPVIPIWQQGGNGNQAPVDKQPTWQQNNGNSAPVDNRPTWQQNSGKGNAAPPDSRPVIPSWQQNQGAPGGAPPAWQQHPSTPAPAPKSGGAPVQKW